MHKLKVVKQGNRLSVELPDDVVARLDLAEGVELLLSEADDGYRLSSGNAGFDGAMKSARKVMTHYRETLRALAK